MLPLVNKYTIFGDCEGTKKELCKFKNNFEILQVFLGDIENKLSETFDIGGHIDNIRKEAALINQTFAAKVDATALRGPVSRIINSEQRELLINWIGGNKKFKLLYRASKDGYLADIFHAKCRDKGPTITIIKSRDGYIFGGYISSSWSRDNGLTIGAKHAFLFTICNPFSIPPTKYPCIDTSYVASCSDYFGPEFGSNDIKITHDCFKYESDISFPKKYEDITGHGVETFTGSKYFFVLDYEVFAVTDITN
jgi:hypothetical protein